MCGQAEPLIEIEAVFAVEEGRCSGGHEDRFEGVKLANCWEWGMFGEEQEEEQGTGTGNREEGAVTALRFSPL
jgi:hypothetical protein